MEVLARELESSIEDRLRQMPAVVLLGPRQVRKTTLARCIPSRRKSRALFLGHPVAGSSWEGFVIENILSVAGSSRTPYYYRTEDRSAREVLKPRECLLLHSGSDAWPVEKVVEAISLAHDATT